MVNELDYLKESASQTAGPYVHIGLAPHQAGFDIFEKNFTNAEDAEILFWTGYAWLARVNIDKENVRQVSRVWIGVEMLERANALDPAYMRYGASLAIAAYHSRSGMADTAKAKAIFEDVIAKTQRKALLALVNYASRYGCLKQDRSLYEKTLQEVVNAQDPDPALFHGGGLPLTAPVAFP